MDYSIKIKFHPVCIPLQPAMSVFDQLNTHMFKQKYIGMSVAAL